MPADGSLIKNFVLAPNQTHSITDDFAGGKYCEVVSRPPAQVKDWPPACTNAVTGQRGKVGENLKVGSTYD
jgi:hypothetical protein